MMAEASAVTVRLAERTDVPAILAISNHYVATSAANFAIEPESLESWQRAFDETSAMYPWLVAVGRLSSPLPPPAGGEGGVVGFAKASPWKGRCAYASSAEVTVYVHPEQHRRGIGRALYGRLLEILQAQGYHTLLAGITTPNPASERLHESFGFQCAGTFRGVGWKFDAWHDVAYWQRTFPSSHDAPSAIKPVGEVAIQIG